MANVARANKAKRAKIIARDGNKCFYCGLPMDDPTIEHLVPSTKGGKSQLDNLVLAHKACNQFVGDMTVLEKIKIRDAFRSPKLRKTMLYVMEEYK